MINATSNGSTINSSNSTPFSDKVPRPYPVARVTFSVFVQNDELKKEYSDITSWMSINAPLFYLHVKFEGSKNKSATLSKIDIKLYSNCESLGFNLYGNPEALYGIERFYTEYVTYLEELRALSIPMKHHLRQQVEGRIQEMNFLGQLTKSKASTGDEAKFGAGWNEFVYKVVDLFNEKDLYEKVRTKYYRDRLRIEAKGQLDRVIAWNVANKYAMDLKFDATSHRTQLVYKPVSRANALDTIDWVEGAADFGLDKLTSSQTYGLQIHVSILNSSNVMNTFVQRTNN